MPENTQDRELVEILVWIINGLYGGGSWSRMEDERPEINDAMARADRLIRDA